MKKCKRGVILILVVSVLYGCKSKKTDISTVSDKEESFVIIDKIQAKESFFNGQCLFVDARKASLYNLGHIPKAINLSPSEDDRLKNEFVNKYPKNINIIVYCGGRQCTASSYSLARKLIENGYKNVSVFYGGWEDWVELSCPIERSEEIK